MSHTRGRPVNQAAPIKREDIPATHPTRLFSDYWCGIRGENAVPLRQDFDPMAIPALLPYLALIEPGERNGVPDFIVRLEGEHVAYLSGNDARGKYFSEFMSADVFTHRKVAFAEVMQNSQPRFEAGSIAHFKKNFIEVVHGVFPLSLKGNLVDQIVVVVAITQTRV